MQNDPDRVLHPLRRRPDGTFEPVTWDDALDDIGRRLKALLDAHGSESIGWYVGNQIAFNYSAFFWITGFMAAIRSPHLYTAASVDINNRWAASAALYGNPLTNPVPDLEGNDFLFLVGTNPFVSHGSMWTVPRIRSGAGGSSSSTPGGRRRPRPSSTCPFGPTATPGCWHRCCT